MRSRWRRRAETRRPGCSIIRIELGQYASGDYQRVRAEHGIVRSMSRRGDCWDNAVAGSFFATLTASDVGSSESDPQ